MCEVEGGRRKGWDKTIRVCMCDSVYVCACVNSSQKTVRLCLKPSKNHEGFKGRQPSGGGEISKYTGKALSTGGERKHGDHFM